VVSIDVPNRNKGPLARLVQHTLWGLVTSGMARAFSSGLDPSAGYAHANEGHRPLLSGIGRRMGAL